MTSSLIEWIPLTERAGKHLVAVAALLFAFGCSITSWGQSQVPRQVPVDSLIYDLKNPDPVRRKDAAMNLGANKVRKAVPDLVAAAGDSDPAVRREIVFALDKMLDIRALPAFVQLSADSEKDIRERSIAGLINLYLPQERGLAVTLNKVASFFNPWSDEWADVVVEPGIAVDPAAIGAMRARMQDVDEGIRAKAVRALGIMRGRDAVPNLGESLNQDRSNAVRFEVVRSLRKIGDQSVAKDLMNYASYSDTKIRNEAVYTLGRFRYREAVPELTRLFEKESQLPQKQSDKTYRETLMDALAFTGDPSSKDLFLKESKAPEEIIRLRATEGLARIGDPTMVTDLSRERLREKDLKIRTALAYAIYRMGRKEYLDEVVNALGSRKSNQEAKQYLVELNPAEMEELYVQTKNNDVNVREGLAEVFGLIGDNQAIPALQELSKDRRGRISALANQAIRGITARTGAR